MPPAWLAVLAWVALVVAVASAAEIAYDLFGRGYRQKMPVMAAVWPVTAVVLRAGGELGVPPFRPP